MLFWDLYCSVAFFSGTLIFLPLFDLWVFWMGRWKFLLFFWDNWDFCVEEWKVLKLWGHWGSLGFTSDAIESAFGFWFWMSLMRSGVGFDFCYKELHLPFRFVYGWSVLIAWERERGRVGWLNFWFISVSFCMSLDLLIRLAVSYLMFCEWIGSYFLFIHLSIVTKKRQTEGWIRRIKC